jgi:hypothetical protein
MIIEPTYLGDGVYVKPKAGDPTSLVLTTGSHVTAAAENVVILEDQVAQALAEYILLWRKT